MSGFEFAKQELHGELKFTADISQVTGPDVGNSIQLIRGHLRDNKLKAALIDLSMLKNLPQGFVAYLLQLRRSFEEEKIKSAIIADETVRNELRLAGLESIWLTSSSHADALECLGIASGQDRIADVAPAPMQDSPGENISVESHQSSAEPPPFEFENQRGYCSVQFNPILMSMSWADVEAATSEVIEKVKASSNNSVMVDLAPMPIINSGLVASLVRIWKAMQAQKGQFSLVSPNEMVTDVLKSAGLWKLWTVVDEREEAVYELGAGEVAMVEKRERRLLMLVSVPCALIAVFALLLTYTNTAGKWGANTYLSALLLASASLTTGLLSILKDKGFRRLFSALAVLTSIGVLSSLAFDKNPLALLGHSQVPAVPDSQPTFGSSRTTTSQKTDPDNNSIQQGDVGEPTNSDGDTPDEGQPENKKKDPDSDLEPTSEQTPKLDDKAVPTPDSADPQEPKKSDGDSSASSDTELTKDLKSD